MSYDLIREDVPEFVKRVGDYVVQGSNNSMMILGTDRAASGPADHSTGLGHAKAAGSGKGTGVVHHIAGRKSSNPDLDKDMSYLYLAMKTEADKNLKTDNVEGNSGTGPAAIVKSDMIRLVVRKDIKIVFDKTDNYIYLTENNCVIRIGKTLINMTGDRVVVDGPKINLGEKASKDVGAMIRGNVFTDEFLNHGHFANTGPTGGVNPVTIPKIFTNQHLSTKSFVE
jgi:hypothetical protein